MTTSLQEIASGVFGELSNNDSALQDLPGWDSMNHMRFIMLIEEQFDVVLEGDDIVEMTSLSEVARVLAKYHVDL